MSFYYPNKKQSVCELQLYYSCEWEYVNVYYPYDNIE